METITGNLYDFPKYYEVVFGSDWAAEFRFLRACFQRYVPREVRRVFEPACGTGRLLVQFAKAGYEVAGNDLNPKAVRYCQSRFERAGLAGTIVEGDMSAFRLADLGSRKKFDAAFNTINSFRHLPDEAAAEAHLNCVADALAKGGLYILGLHLTPTQGPRVDEESWSARRGNLAVNSHMWSIALDMKQRNERVGMTFDVYTPTRQFRIEDEMQYRTYTAEQMQNLFDRTSRFEVVETFDFTYDIDGPVTIDGLTEDVIYVLRRV